MSSTRIRPPRAGDGRRRVLDLEHYTPYFIGAIANKWSRASSRLYLKLFGVGVAEWRVMAMLAIEPRSTAHRICQVIGMDKAAASRSLKALKKMRLIAVREKQGRSHRRPVELTKAGYALHDRIMDLALERERVLLGDFTAAEIKQITGFLRRMHARVPDLAEYRPTGEKN